MLSEAVRVEPKGFFQRRPDGAGGHIYDRQGVRRVPYRLSELIAAQTESPVFVPEGEKDVDQLVALGLTATCNPEGAGKWRSDYNAHFEGRDVFVLPDNDDPGLRHAIQVAESLGTVASSVRIVPLPDLPDGGDVSDWLEAGGTREELLELAVGAPEYRPTGKANVNGAKPYPEMPDGADHLTDLGNAKRLVAQYGQDFHYVYPFKSFLSWGETHWRQEDSGRISAMAKATVMGMYKEAAGLKQQAADAEANGDEVGWRYIVAQGQDCPFEMGQAVRGCAPNCIHARARQVGARCPNHASTT